MTATMTRVAEEIGPESGPIPQAPYPPHPLDPLSPAEIAVVVRVLRTEMPLPAGSRFAGVTLHEPSKEVVYGWQPGDPVDRNAFVIVFEPQIEATYEAVVAVDDGFVRSFRRVPGVQPPYLWDEFGELERAAKAHPDYQAALAKRGITDLDLVAIDGWSAGHYGDEDGRRLLRGLSFARAVPGGNAYAHPIEGVIVLYDAAKGEVVRVEDHGPTIVPQAPGEFMDGTVPPRSDLKPIEIRQPEGISFTLNGYELRWQKWRLRIGFTPREGLVLHTVGYEDGGRVRPILYRAALSEMVVPYGDPAPLQARKNAFDAGEYNLGMMVTSLELGCDCLGEIRYLDATVADPSGSPVTFRNAVCVHEEDANLLWRHFDAGRGKTEVRRSRRLVISFWATVGNYDYGFFWYLYQDGAIEAEVKMTGIVTTGALAPDTAEPYPFGQRLSSDGLYAPIHQHFFNFRLDLDVDGTRNVLEEVEGEAVPLGADNPTGALFVSRATPLRRESEAQRLTNPASGRCWVVRNPRVRNHLGEPVGYRLVPKGGLLPFAAPDASASRRAGFMFKHLWATPYRADERYAAGDYPILHPGGAGLPAWTAADRSLEDEDFVLWHTIGSHHPVRPEDWPIMPVQCIGFRLEPSGFFDRNPALDVPAPTPAHGAHCQP